MLPPLYGDEPQVCMEVAGSILGFTSMFYEPLVSSSSRPSFPGGPHA